MVAPTERKAAATAAIHILKIIRFIVPYAFDLLLPFTHPSEVVLRQHAGWITKGA